MGRTACTEPQCLYKGALYLLPISLFLNTLSICSSLNVNWLFTWLVSYFLFLNGCLVGELDRQLTSWF